MSATAGCVAVEVWPLVVRDMARTSPLTRLAERGAQREGCTEAEWWRRAGAERVLRQRARGGVS